MAQGDEGAPRKSKTYRDFSGMNSQNERYKIGDDEFFWMENIMRVGPRKLHSVPGPSNILIHFGGPCPPETAPGNQQITQEACYNIQTGIPPGTLSGNTRASWGYVTPQGEIIVLINDAGTGGGDHHYPLNSQVLHIFPSGAITTETPIPFAQNAGGLPNITMGKSDELSYVVDIVPIGETHNGLTYFSWPNQTAVSCIYGATPQVLANPANLAQGPNWCKKGNSIYVFSGWLQPSPAYNVLAEFNATTGAFVQEAVDLIQPVLTGFLQSTPIRDMQATDNFLYVLANDPTTYPFTSSVIYKINRSDLTLADTFTFDYKVQIAGAFTTLYFSAWAFSVITDDFLYLIRTSVSWDNISNYEFGYYDTTTQQYIFIDRVPGSDFCADAFLLGQGFWAQNRTFYFGFSGNGGSSVEISKTMPLDCPTPENLSGGVLISRAFFEIGPPPEFIFLVSPAGDFLKSPGGDFLVQ